MQNLRTLRQPLLGELAMSRKKEREREREREKTNVICSGHPRLCQQPRAAHALRSDQNMLQSVCLMLNLTQLTLPCPLLQGQRLQTFAESESLYYPLQTYKDNSFRCICWLALSTQYEG